MNPRAPLVLIADDDVEFREVLGETLERLGYDVLGVGDGRAAMAKLDQLEARAPGSVQCVLSDVRMPDGTGVDLLRHVRRNHPGIRVVLISGYAPDGESELALGADGFLSKPFDVQTLRSVLQSALMDSQSASDSTTKSPSLPSPEA